MLTAGLAQILATTAGPSFVARDAADRAAAFAWIAEVRQRCDLPARRRLKGLTEEDVHMLGMAAHEVSHAAVAVAVGDIAERVFVSRDTLSGQAHYWPRDPETCGSIIARIAVLRAGVDGFYLATGDAAGAWLSAQTDRAEVAAVLGQTRLPVEACATAERLAERIVARVLSDPKCWESVTDLTIRLTDVGAIEGDELHRRLVIPDDVLAYARALVA